MCPFTFGSNSLSGDILCFGIKIFLLIWVVFVPIAITNRLERIIQKLDNLEKTD